MKDNNNDNTNRDRGRVVLASAQITRSLDLFLYHSIDLSTYVSISYLFFNLFLDLFLYHSIDLSTYVSISLSLSCLDRVMVVRVLRHRSVSGSCPPCGNRIRIVSHSHPSGYIIRIISPEDRVLIRLDTSTVYPVNIYIYI